MYDGSRNFTSKDEKYDEVDEGSLRGLSTIYRSNEPVPQEGLPTP